MINKYTGILQREEEKEERYMMMTKEDIFLATTLFIIVLSVRTTSHSILNIYTYTCKS